MKTGRRLIDSGALLACRGGRRLLAAFKDTGVFRLSRRVPTMSIVTTRETIDPVTGRARPLSAQEQRARAEAFARGLDDDVLAADETDTDQVWAEFFRGIDESRPHRPLFEGRY